MDMTSHMTSHHSVLILLDIEKLYQVEDFGYYNGQS